MKSKCRALVPVKPRPGDVNDARAFFLRNGIAAHRLYDHASFVEADNEFCYRVKPGEVGLWADAAHTLRYHLRRGWYQPTRHRTSFWYRNLDNVYRLTDLWSK